MKSPSAASKSQGEMTSFYDLMKLSPDALAKTDIGLMNLLCATGLRGAEKLDVQQCLWTLDSWATRVKSETNKYLYQFRDNPGGFQNSLAYFKMIMLVTVLQQDFNVHYNPARADNPDFTDSKDLLIHGLLGDSRAGTCMSMPVLYVAVARRLGYPVYLAQAKAHSYVKWEDDYEKLNIEATSQGIICRGDDYYTKWPMPLSQSDLASGAYLRKLNAQEELSIFLTARGHCLEDAGHFPEAEVAYALAHATAPQMPNGVGFLATALLRESPTAEGLLVAHVSTRAQPPMMDRRGPSVEEMNEMNRRAVERATSPLIRQNPSNPNPFNSDSPF